jgi:hypothetical protein
MVLDRDSRSSRGCRVQAVGSGAQAESELQTDGIPEIIFSDFRHGETMHGLDLVSSFRSLRDHPIPACWISGDFDPQLMNQAKLHNLTPLAKPVRPAKLRNFYVIC